MNKFLKLLSFLKRNKGRIRNVRELNGFYAISLLGLYSCGGGGDSGGEGGGVKSLIEEPENTEGFTEISENSRRFEGTNEADAFAGSTGNERVQVNGGGGDDVIVTGAGDDVVRGGAGRDEINTGGGDDVILLIGETMASAYVNDDIEPLLKQFLLDELNKVNDRIESDVSLPDEDEEGGEDELEIIEGGEGVDTLIVYGELDLSRVRIEGIEKLIVHSDLKLSAKQLSKFNVIQGDGGSRLIILNEGGRKLSLNARDLGDLSGIKELRLEEGVILRVGSEEAVESLRGVGYVSGEGSFVVSDEKLLVGEKVDEVFSFDVSIKDNVKVGNEEVEVKSFSLFVSVNEGEAKEEELDVNDINLSVYNIVESELNGVRLNIGERKLIIPALSFADGKGYVVKLLNEEGDFKLVSVIVSEASDGPEAFDDVGLSVEEEGELSISLEVLLSNDEDDNLLDEELKIIGVSSANNEVEIDREKGVVNFKASENYFGTDTVTYTVEDTIGNTDTAEFEVSVVNVEDEGVLSLRDGSISERGWLRMEIMLEDYDGIDGADVRFEFLDGEGDLLWEFSESGVGDVAEVEFRYYVGEEDVSLYKVKAFYSDGEGVVYGGDDEGGDGGLPALEVLLGEVGEIITSVLSVSERELEIGGIEVSGGRGDFVYSLGDGLDGEFFSIDEETGILSFVEGADYENPMDIGKNNEYELLVMVDDGVFVVSKILKVSVEDASSLMGELSVLGELREGETITASLRDEDGLVLGETVSFELFTVEGEEEESVSMQEIEVMDVDVVEAIFVLDSEGIGGKEILLKAVYTDGEGTIYDGGSDNEAIVLSEIYEVENVNDAPVIDVLADVSVDEGDVEIPVLSSVSDEEGDSLSFSIDASRDGDLFSVDEGTGKLRFKEGADYEMAMDVGADNVYEVLLTASDGEDASSEVLRVTVGDISTGEGILELMGDVEEGGTITASLNDEDGLANGATVTFELFSVEGETETSILVEEVEMSAVGNRASANFVLDGDGIEGKEIIVKAMYADAGGNSGDLVSEMYTVEDGNDAPVIELLGDLTVEEESVEFFEVVSVTDEEEDSLTFSIDVSMDGGLFSVDVDTGELRFKMAADYEDPRDVF